MPFTEIDQFFDNETSPEVKDHLNQQIVDQVNEHIQSGIGVLEPEIPNPHQVTVAQLADVSADSPADNDVLQYESTSSQWIARSLAAAGVVGGTAGVSGHVARWEADGTLGDAGYTPYEAGWNAAAIRSRNVVATAPTANQALLWSADNNQWEPGDVVSGAGKADKADPAVDGHVAALDATGNLEDAGYTPYEAGWNAYWLQGRELAATAPTASQVVLWSVANDRWEPGSRDEQSVGAGASPTFVGATLSGLVASRLVALNGDKALTNTILASWISGTANQLTVTGTAGGGVTLSLPQDIHTAATPQFARIGIGGEPSVAAGQLARITGDGASAYWVAQGFAGVPGLATERSEGSEASPVATADTSVIGLMTFKGRATDGVMSYGAYDEFVVEGSPSAGFVPIRRNFGIAIDASSSRRVLTMAADGCDIILPIETYAGSPGAGTTYQIGRIILDKFRSLWQCTGSGDPGTWVQVTPARGGAAPVAGDFPGGAILEGYRWVDTTNHRPWFYTTISATSGWVSEEIHTIDFQPTSFNLWTAVGWTGDGEALVYCCPNLFDLLVLEATARVYGYTGGTWNASNKWDIDLENAAGSDISTVAKTTSGVTEHDLTPAGAAVWITAQNQLRIWVRKTGAADTLKPYSFTMLARWVRK